MLLQRLALKVTTMPNHDFLRSKNVLMQNCLARTLHSQYQFFDTAAFADTGEEFVKDFFCLCCTEWMDPPQSKNSDDLAKRADNTGFRSFSAEFHFETWPGHQHFWHIDSIRGVVVVACSVVGWLVGWLVGGSDADHPADGYFDIHRPALRWEILRPKKGGWNKQRNNLICEAVRLRCETAWIPEKKKNSPGVKFLLVFRPQRGPLS